MPHEFTGESFTRRMRLAPPDPSLDEKIVYIRTPSETLEYLRGFPTKITVEEVRALREQRSEDPTRIDLYAFSLKEDRTQGELVGLSGIFNIDENQNSCEIGIVVVPGKHRNGYATEILYCAMKWLFEEKKFHRATLETAADEMAGIRQEAERKEAWRAAVEGEYIDTNC